MLDNYSESGDNDNGAQEIVFDNAFKYDKDDFDMADFDDDDQSDNNFSVHNSQSLPKSNNKLV